MDGNTLFYTNNSCLGKERPITAFRLFKKKKFKEKTEAMSDETD